MMSAKTPARFQRSRAAWRSACVETCTLCSLTWKTAYDERKAVHSIPTLRFRRFRFQRYRLQRFRFRAFLPFENAVFAPLWAHEI